MILVYRIEHPKDGMGPYTSDYSTSDIVIMKLNHCKTLNTHPSPLGEFRREPNDAERFAFTKRKHLKRWFDGYFESLEQCGFVVKVFKISRSYCRIGEQSGQVMFDPRYAEVIKTMQLSAL